MRSLLERSAYTHRIALQWTAKLAHERPLRAPSKKRPPATASRAGRGPGLAETLPGVFPGPGNIPLEFRRKGSMAPRLLLKVHD